MVWKNVACSLLQNFRSTKADALLALVDFLEFIKPVVTVPFKLGATVDQVIIRV